MRIESVCTFRDGLSFLIKNALMDTGKNRRQFVNIYFSEDNSNVPPCFLEQFHVLPKCSIRFDCLINEMLNIRKLKPSLNVQTVRFAQRSSLKEILDLLLLC